MKKKKPSLKRLKEKADKLLSLYVRQRDADQHGIVKCVTCSNKTHWKGVDCGHWLSRSYLSTRFEETNVAAQCKRCNAWFGGRPDDFERFIAAKHGKEEVERLRALKHQSIKRTTSDYEELISELQEKLKRFE